MQDNGKDNTNKKDILQLKKDGISCIGIGTGVGGLGAAVAAATASAVCPLCIVIAPTLIGIGIHRLLKAKKALK